MRTTSLLLLIVALGWACASTKDRDAELEEVEAIEEELDAAAADQAALPEVRYYVIADT